MTHLPHDHRHVRGVKDYAYEPEHQCAHPFCTETTGLQRHHLWPKSFLRGQPLDWVIAPFGVQVGNVVRLCLEHHRRITENEARIVWDEKLRKFFWQGTGALNPHPPVSPGVPAASGAESSTTPGRLLSLKESKDILRHTSTHSESLEASTEPHRGIPEGQPCPTCQRRVPYKRKKSSPQSKTVSFRLPIDNAPEWDEIIEQSASHLGVSQEDKYWRWKTMERALVLALQGPASE